MSDDAITTAQRRFAKSETPKGWRPIRLGEVFDSIVDRGHTADLPVLSVTLTQGVVRRETLDRSSEREVERDEYLRAARGDIAYNTMRMWQGASGLVQEAGYLSPAYTVCRPRAGEHAEFWAQCFKAPSMIRGFLDHSQGVAKDRFRLYFQHFATVPALRPPLGEQRTIAAILASVDDAIAATQAVVDQLAVVKKAMMADLLTRGIPGRHTRFKQTEIGEVPEGWKVARLGDVLDDGPTNGIYKPAHLIGRGALIAGMRAIDGGTIRWGECRRAEVERSELERFGLRRGDILVTRVYANIEGIGRFIVVPEPREDAVYESNMMRIRIDPGFAVPEFVALHMGLVDLRKEIEQQATLGAQASINSTAIRMLPLRLPSLQEQTQITELFLSLEHRTNDEQRSLGALRSLKSALSAALLSGDVRVTPDAEAP